MPMLTTEQNNLAQVAQAMLKSVAVNTMDPKARYIADSYEVEAMVTGLNDHGRCVGKKGVVIWAMNTIMWWAGSAQIARPVRINLIPPSPNKAPVKMPFKPHTSWKTVNLATITEMLDITLTACFKGVKQAWVVEKQKEVGHAIIHIRLDSYLQTAMLEPNFEDALKVLIHAAGMSRGLRLEANVTWA